MFRATFYRATFYRATFFRATFCALFLGLLLASCSHRSAPEPRSLPVPSPEERGPAATEETVEDSERRVTLLAINDVYRIEGPEDGADGGLARFRQLRRELEEKAPDLLVLHAGDLLFPSLLSREFKGGQMIDVLNRLDGDGEAFDERLFATFGNHEFDKESLEDAALLDRRVEASQFAWFDTNIDWKADSAGHPLVEEEQMIPWHLVESGGVQVGLFGLTTDLAHPEYVEAFGSPLEAARRTCATLRAEGAEVVVGLTHLVLGKDVELLQQLGAEGPDLVLGGHEHNRLCRKVTASGTVEDCALEPAQQISVSLDQGRVVLKADAEARTATVAEIVLPSQGPLRIEAEFREMGEDYPRDPTLQAVIDQWLVRHDEIFCREDLEKPPGCLAEVLGQTQVTLVGEELEIRRYETNLGNWILDQALEAHRDVGAVAAVTNSGGLRLNQDLPPGAISRRHVEEIFQFPSYLRVLDVKGAVLQKMLDHSVSDWTGNGKWLQVAGVAFRHDPETETADRLTLLTPEGPRSIDPDETLRIVSGDYIAGGKDGYVMLGEDQWVETGQDLLNLKELTLSGLAAAGSQGIAPTVEGRICNTQRPEEPCLAVGE